MNFNLEFQHLLQKTGVLRLHFDPAGALIEGADALARLTGFEPQELRGQGWAEKLLPEGLEEQQDALLGKQEQPGSACRLELITRDGSRVLLACQLNRQFDSRGKLAGVLAVGVDITECKRIEGELQRTNEMLTKLFDQIPVMITVYRPDIHMLQVNKAFENLIGWSSEEASRVDIMEVCYPDPEYREMVREFMDSLDQSWRDFKVTARDGSVVESSWTNIALSDDTHIGIGIDMRERRRSEMERERLLDRVREERDRLKALVESLDDEVWLCDENGYLTLVNSSVAQGLGVEPGQIVGQSLEAIVTDVLEIFSPDGNPRTAQETPLLRSLNGEKTLGEELIRNHHTGEMKWRQYRSTPIREESGGIRGAVAVVRDITEMKRAEEALRQSEARLRIAMENSDVMVFEQDSDLRYTWLANPFPDSTIEDTLGKGDYDLLQKEDADRLTAIKRSVLETGEETRQEVRLNIDGQPRYYDLFVESSRDSNGEINGVLCSTVDVTFRKQAEESLRRVNETLDARVKKRTRELQEEIHERQQAEAELAEMQRRLMDSVEAERTLLARELHDGPMQEIYAVIYSLATLDTGDAEGELVGEINRLQDRLKEINRSLRATTHHLRPSSLGAFGLEKSIREHIDRLRVDQHSLDVSLNLMSDGTCLPEEVRLALYRIYQMAITNVIRHAQASRAEVTFRFDNEFIVLTIEDNGRGFRRPARLIDFARQGHLGLLGAYERARAIGGELKINTQPGQGTSIRVVVPR
jgi:PAS domain S-box-containing protein